MISQFDVVCVYVTLGVCLGGALFGLPVTTFFLPEFVWRDIGIRPYFIRVVFFGALVTTFKALMLFWMLD
jgi:hypothetical protein